MLFRSRRSAGRVRCACGGGGGSPADLLDRTPAPAKTTLWIKAALPRSEAMFFNARTAASASTHTTPVASSIVIKSLIDLQAQLATEIDRQVQQYPLLAPSKKEVPSPGVDVKLV